MAAPLTKRFLERRLGSTASQGSLCAMCHHPRRRRIEAEAKAFNEARRTGRTTVRWSTYVNRVLRPALRCTTAVPFLRHLKEDLGWKIH